MLSAFVYVLRFFVYGIADLVGVSCVNLTLGQGIVLDLNVHVFVRANFIAVRMFCILFFKESRESRESSECALECVSFGFCENEFEFESHNTKFRGSRESSSASIAQQNASWRLCSWHASEQ